MNSLDSDMANVNGDNLTYFDSFGVEYIPKKPKNYRQQKYYN